ncbi:MAG: hypothetical protein V4645_14675 [Pseudomonadota bacterium]
MSIVEITSWKPGFRKVSCTVLLREVLQLGLAEAKGVTDGIMAGKVQRIEAATAFIADDLVARLNALGAIACLATDMKEK